LKTKFPSALGVFFLLLLVALLVAAPLQLANSPPTNSSSWAANDYESIASLPALRLSNGLDTMISSTHTAAMQHDGFTIATVAPARSYLALGLATLDIPALIYTSTQQINCAGLIQVASAFPSTVCQRETSVLLAGFSTQGEMLAGGVQHFSINTATRPAVSAATNTAPVASCICSHPGTATFANAYISNIALVLIFKT